MVVVFVGGWLHGVGAFNMFLTMGIVVGAKEVVVVGVIEVVIKVVVVVIVGG